MWYFQKYNKLKPQLTTTTTTTKVTPQKKKKKRKRKVLKHYTMLCLNRTRNNYENTHTCDHSNKSEKCEVNNKK